MSRPMRSLKELGTLKERLAALEAARAAPPRAEPPPAFAAAVGPVHRLKDRGLAPPARPRPAPVALQRALDERAALRSALSDEVDVESLLDTDEALSFRRAGVGPDVVRRLRRGEWAIQGEIDLHGLTRDAAREQLAQFVRAAVQRGLRCVRVVRGKGHGSPGRAPVLKGKVRTWLVQKAEVVAFAQARAAQGGAGALVVLLRG
jgi:DNA-nicking Smr family endonuclease